MKISINNSEKLTLEKMRERINSEIDYYQKQLESSQNKLKLINSIEYED